MLHFRLMHKDSRLSFRVRSHLKKALEAIAVAEGRSVAQVCEAFLTTGCESYKDQGAAFLRRGLGRKKTQSTQS